MLKLDGFGAEASARPRATSSTRIETFAARAVAGAARVTTTAARRGFFIDDDPVETRTVPEPGFALKCKPPVANRILTVDDTSAGGGLDGSAAPRGIGRRAPSRECATRARDPLHLRRQPGDAGLGQQPDVVCGLTRVRRGGHRARHARRARGVDAEDRAARALA